MTETTLGRALLLRRALRLEYLTVDWNVVEGLVAVIAAVAAGSIALLGFGVDSFVECASALVLLWRLRAERHAMDTEAIERLDHRAHRLVGVSLFLLAAYIAFDAILALWKRDHPSASPVGIGAHGALDLRHDVACSREAPGRCRARQPRARVRRVPDHGLLLAIGDHARWARAERPARLVVGGSGRGAGDDVVHRPRGRRGVEGRGVWLQRRCSGGGRLGVRTDRRVRRRRKGSLRMPRGARPLSEAPRILTGRLKARSTPTA